MTCLWVNNDNKLVVEHGIDGREVECAVLQGRNGSAPRVSLAGEIVVTGREFYDFVAKYRSTSSSSDLAPELDAAVAAEVPANRSATIANTIIASARSNIAVTIRHKVVLVPLIPGA